MELSIGESIDPTLKPALFSTYSSLDQVKKRIIEHLSVIKIKGDLKAPILCFVGPVSGSMKPSIAMY
jgi:ATP-dependent Lon protease